MTTEHKPHSVLDEARDYLGLEDPENRVEPTDFQDALIYNLIEQLETLEWFLRHRTAEDGMTQWEVYEQIDWSTHPEFASNPAMSPEHEAGYAGTNEELAESQAQGLGDPGDFVTPYAEWTISERSEDASSDAVTPRVDGNDGPPAHNQDTSRDET